MSTSWLLILVIIVNYCQGSVIDTSDTLFFTDSNITCASNNSCSIYCDEDIDGQGACESSLINCPSDYDCDIWCTIKRACLGSTINCPLNGECNIYCFADYACREIEIIKGNTEPTLVCENDANVCRYITFPIPPSDEPMEQICGDNGCAGSTLYCPANAQCDIICSGG